MDSSNNIGTDISDILAVWPKCMHINHNPHIGYLCLYNDDTIYVEMHKNNQISSSL